MALGAEELLRKLDSLGASLEHQGKKIRELEEQQGVLRGSLQELKEAVGRWELPRERAAVGGWSGRQKSMSPRLTAGGRPTLLAVGRPSSGLSYLFGGERRQVLRRAIVNGSVSAGIGQVTDLLRQLQEFLEDVLKIIETVRGNLQGSGTLSAGPTVPILSKDTVEVVARMVKMPEFQRLVANLLTLALRDENEASWRAAG